VTTIEIKGMTELSKILRELPYQVRSKLVFTALRKAAKPMKDEAVNLAPKRSGTTKRAIVMVVNKFEDLPGLMIAPTKGKKFQGEGEANRDAWYSRFQEYGTSGFGKRRRSLKSVSVNLKYGTINRKFQTTGYKRGGSGLPAVRFMARAFDAKKEQALGSINKELSQVVTKYLQKNAPRYYVNRSHI